MGNKILATLCIILAVSIILFAAITSTFIPENYLILWYIFCFILGLFTGWFIYAIFALGRKDE